MVCSVLGSSGDERRCDHAQTLIHALVVLTDGKTWPISEGSVSYQYVIGLAIIFIIAGEAKDVAARRALVVHLSTAVLSNLAKQSLFQNIAVSHVLST